MGRLIEQPTQRRGESTSEQIAEMREKWLRARERFRPFHHEIARDYDFLIKQNHYGTDQAKQLAESGSPSVKTVDLYDLNRYVAAEVAGTKIYIDVKPGPNRDEVTAPAVAEIVRKVLQKDTTDLQKGYPAVRRSVIRMGGAARAGCAVLEIIPNGSRLGTEIVPVAIDPSTAFWDIDYWHPNQYGCPWFAQEVRMDYREAQKRWKLTDEQIGPDDGERPLERRTAEPKVQPDEERTKVTLLKVWYMKGYPGAAPANAELSPRQRYMLCEKCGYTEEPLTFASDYDGSSLPAQAECPSCASAAAEGDAPQMLQRQDRERPDSEHQHIAERGFQIIAPFWPQAEYLEDAPIDPRIEGFPVLFYVPDPFPIEPFGNSDAFLHRDVQCAKDAVLRMSLEQMQRNRDLLVVKEDALWDAQHEPYQFDGSGDYVAFAGSVEDVQAMKQFQGSGMNAAAPAFLGILDSAMQRTRGTGQLQLSGQELAQATASGITRTQETGDVPVDERIAIWREQESMFLRRWMELDIAYWSPQHWRRLLGAEDGNLAMELLVDPLELDFDVIITAEPGIDPGVQAKLEALDSLAGGNPLLLQSPEMLKIKARVANLPEEWSNELIAAAQRLSAPPPPPPGVGGGPPGPAQGFGQPPALPQMNGPSPQAPAGMSPAGLPTR